MPPLFQNNEKFIRDIRIDKSRERNIACYLGLGKWDRERILPGYITEQLLLLTSHLGEGNGEPAPNRKRAALLAQGGIHTTGKPTPVQKGPRLGVFGHPVS